eukprot:448236_1
MPFNPTSNCHTCAFCGRIFPLITHAAPTRPIDRSCATAFAFRSTRNSIYGLAHPPALHPCHSHPRCTVTFPRASPSTGTCHAASGESGCCHRARRARPSPNGKPPRRSGRAPFMRSSTADCHCLEAFRFSSHPPALHPCHSHPSCTGTFPRASPSTGTCHAASGESGGCHRARRARASPHGNRRAAPAALRSCVVRPPTATAWRRSASHHIRRHFIHAILTPVVLALSLALLLRLE